MSIDIIAFNKTLLNRQNKQIDPKIYDFIIQTNRYSLQLDEHDSYGEPMFKRLMSITCNGQKLINYVDMIRKHEEFDVIKRFYQLQIMELDEQSDIKMGYEIRKATKRNFIQYHVGYIEGCYNCIKCSFELYLSFRQLFQKQHLKLILDLLFYHVYKSDYRAYKYYTIPEKPKQVEIQFIDPSISKTPMFCDSYEYSLKCKYEDVPYITTSNTTTGEYYLYSKKVLSTLWEIMRSFITKHEEQCKTQLVLHKSIRDPSKCSKCEYCKKYIFTTCMTYYKCCHCYCCPICLLERLIPFYGNKVENRHLIVNDPFNYAMILRQCPLCKKDQGYIMYSDEASESSETYDDEENDESENSCMFYVVKAESEDSDK